MAFTQCDNRASKAPLWFRVLAVCILALTFLWHSTFRMLYYLIEGFPELAREVATKYVSELWVVGGVLRGVAFALFVALCLYTGCRRLRIRALMYLFAGVSLWIVLQGLISWVGSATGERWLRWGGSAVMSLIMVMTLAPFVWVAWRACGPPWAAYRPDEGSERSESPKSSGCSA